LHAQDPEEQVAPLAQTWPHVPQFVPSVDVFVQVPLQRVWSAVQPDTQVPVAEQSGVCEPGTHVLVHEPQCDVVVIAVSQP
jgi:hypothetical protein